MFHAFLRFYYLKSPEEIEKQRGLKYFHLYQLAHSKYRNDDSNNNRKTFIKFLKFKWKKNRRNVIRRFYQLPCLVVAISFFINSPFSLAMR